jgi:hypothetical protein
LPEKAVHHHLDSERIKRIQISQNIRGKRSLQHNQSLQSHCSDQFLKETT